MNLLRSTTAFAVALAIAACDAGPTQPDTDQAAFDAVDPVVITFAATQGLPGGPFNAHAGPPFMGGMQFTGAPQGAADGRGPGAAFPDSIKLSAAQKTRIEALVAAFAVAHAADIAAMKAAHNAARDARKAGKSRAEVKAILEAAKPAADRVRAASESLRAAINALLTPLQRTWLEQHRPDRPPRTP